MSVNDKWHYCHNSDVLVGSRAMRDRHLQLLGYIILQVGMTCILCTRTCCWMTVLVGRKEVFIVLNSGHV